MRRRRASVILEMPEGILVVRMKGFRFGLVGGGIHWGEQPEEGAKREVFEETRLKFSNHIFKASLPIIG